MFVIKRQLNSIILKLMPILKREFFYYLNRKSLELNNINELKKVFRWDKNPVIVRDDIYNFDYLEDLNERRIRDAESLATVLINMDSKVALEIGTADGMGTILMAANTKNGIVYTVNIPPEDVESGEGGKLITAKLSRDNIGVEYKKRNISNIKQIYANTATWEPSIGVVDVAFIDGCHDTNFVYNDTVKVLKQMKAGSFIMWHDYNPDLMNKFHWIKDVCEGVEKLFRNGVLHGKILHVRDSWVGIYQISKEDIDYIRYE